MEKERKIYKHKMHTNDTKSGKTNKWNFTKFLLEVQFMR